MNKQEQFVVGEYYHVFNRGVDKRDIFSDEKDLKRFFKSMEDFNSVKPIGSIYLKNRENTLGFRGETPTCRGFTPKTVKDNGPLVEFVAYCLNPNHFHFILTPLVDRGISEFMKRMGGYTSYFNEKHDRSGALFQGVFKSVHVDSNEQLLHLSAYVNLNNQFGGPIPKLSKSSWEEYFNKNVEQFCTGKNIILEQFKNLESYKKFALSSLEDIKKRKSDEKENSKLFLE